MSLYYHSSYYYGKFEQFPEVEAIYLNKPEVPERLKKQYPNLKGIRLELYKSTFSRSKVDVNQYLKEIAAHFRLEELVLDSNKYLSELPEELQEHPLRKLTIGHAPKLEQLPMGWQAFPYLEKLSFTGEKSQIPKAFLASDKLLEVELKGMVEGVEALSEAVNLEHLSLEESPDTVLRIHFEKLTKLKKFSLQKYSNLSQIPSFKPLVALEHCVLANLPVLTQMPEGWEALFQLNELYCGSLGKPERPLAFSFERLPVLHELHLNNCFFDDTRAFLGEMPALQTLSLSDSALKNWPEKLLQCSDLIRLRLKNCELKSLPNGFKSLREVNIEHLPLEHFPTDWQELSHLKKVGIQDCPDLKQLPAFGRENSNLNTIELKGLPVLKELPESWAKCPKLTEITLTKLQVQQLPLSWLKMPSLKKVLLKEVSLQFIPKEFIVESDRISYRFYKVDCIPEQYESIINDLPGIFYRDKYSAEARLAVGYLLFEMDVSQRLPQNLVPACVEVLNGKNPELKQILFERLYALNPKRQKLSDKDVKDFNGKTVAIAGTSKNSKTQIKEHLQAMGFTYQTKVKKDTDFVMLCNKAKLPEEFCEYPHFYFSEMESEALHKKEKPGFLMEIPDDHLSHLRAMLWTNDPANEKIVLEMIKQGGTPEELWPELIIIAKTSQDKSVKTQLRKLLKAQLPVGAQKILSDPTNLQLSICPYGDYETMAPEFDIASMAVCHYKRSGKFIREFFRLKSSLKSPFRSEFFENVFPQFLEKAHYLKTTGWALTKEEMEQLLSQPLFEGKLKRLMMDGGAMEGIPPSLYKHITLNELSLNITGEKLPDELTQLNRLRILRIQGDQITSIPESFKALIHLKELFVYSKVPVKVPGGVKELSKLKRLYCYPKALN
ncbi:hypothetical protein AAG747_11690 [Rapidithrix thailandica]|uniref:Uncharacterized protein n=1 Tax=Rapidithrix thailandica TaxID=413964 RepID=A0AAW9RUK4_9BACT